MYSVKDHKLLKDNAEVEYKQTPHFTQGTNVGPNGFKAEGIVLHDTAGRLDGNTSVSWFQNPAAKASAHLVVHRNGNVTQMVKFNDKAWHAGTSSLNGRKGVNDFSIGIEIVNPGKLEPLGNGRYAAWFGTIYEDSEFDIVQKTTPEHGSGGWMMYTAAQLEAVEGICVALFSEYSLSWIWPHWKVSPGRKVDTNPMFPLSHIQAKVLGRGADTEDNDDDGVMLANSNQRKWPAYGDNVIQVIPRGTKVEVVRSGWYQNGDEYAEWFLVSHDGHEGWVHSKLIDV